MQQSTLYDSYSNNKKTTTLLDLKYQIMVETQTLTLPSSAHNQLIRWEEGWWGSGERNAAAQHWMLDCDFDCNKQQQQQFETTDWKILKIYILCIYDCVYVVYVYIENFCL